MVRSHRQEIVPGQNATRMQHSLSKLLWSGLIYEI